MSDRSITPENSALECVSPEQLDAERANPYARIVSKMMRQHRLLSVHWELTYRCNEACTHCYLDVFKPNATVAGELNTAQIKQVLDQLAALNVLNITFSGGEALVRQDFFEIAEYARRKRFAFRIFTNGILITPKLADRIAALQPLVVEFSVYAADPQTHDAITTRRRSWELTIRALRLMRERGVHTQIKTPLMHENVHQLDALRELAASVGASFRSDPTLTAKDNGDLSPLGHRLTSDDLLWLYRHEMPADAQTPKPIGDSQRSCAIGLHSLVIDPYGNVFPCVQTRISAGNVLEQSVKEIWNAQLFQQVGLLTFGVLPICRTCELNSFCHRCHANALVETGDMYAPAPPNCRDALARREVMIENGVLPADFPIPAHLRLGVPDELPRMPRVFTKTPALIIPLEAVRKIAVEVAA